MSIRRLGAQTSRVAMDLFGTCSTTQNFTTGPDVPVTDILHFCFAISHCGRSLRGLSGRQRATQVARAAEIRSPTTGKFVPKQRIKV